MVGTPAPVGLLVGDPSRKKTPIINAATRPLEQYEAHSAQELRGADPRLRSGPGDGENLKKPDPPQRYVVGTARSKSSARFYLAASTGCSSSVTNSPAGSAAWKNIATSRGAGADRGFWLQAFDGGPYTVDRIGRGETHIRNFSVSLIGGIQPARLAELHGLTSDGLLQRFLPIMMGPSTLAQDRPCDNEAYSRLVHQLIFAKPPPYLDDDALLGDERFAARPA